MAKEKDAEKQKDTPEEKTEEKTAKKADIRRFLPWITMGVILVFCAGAGFVAYLAAWANLKPSRILKNRFRFRKPQHRTLPKEALRGSGIIPYSRSWQISTNRA
jgi:hypothetical protein